MNNMKYMIKPLLFVILIFSFNLLKGNENQSQILTIPIFEDVPTFDPHKSNSFASISVWMNIFSTLLEEDVHGNIIHNLASKYEISADKLVYTFYLKKNLKWSDGLDITADDIVFSWFRAIEPQTKNPMISELYFIKNAKEYHLGLKSIKKEDVGIQKIDSHTVKITLSNPSPYFLIRFASFVYTILPKHTIEKYGKYWTKLENIVTYGPYTLTKHRTDAKIVLTSFKAYWNAQRINIPQVKYLVLKNNQYYDYLFKKGKIDILDSIPQNKILDWINRKETKIVNNFFVSHLSFNLKKPYFQNILLRKALSCTIHLKKSIILEKYLYKLGRIAKGVVPPGLPYYPYKDYMNECSSKSIKEDFKKAISELSMPLPPFSLVFVSHPELIDFFQIIQDVWMETLGVKSVLVPLSWNSMLAKLVKGEHDLTIMSPAASIFDPIDFLDWYITNEPRNFLGLKDPEYDRLFDEAQKEFDLKNRMIKMAKVEDIINRNFYLIPLFNNQQMYRLNPKLKMVNHNNQLIEPTPDKLGHLSARWINWAFEK